MLAAAGRIQQAAAEKRAEEKQCAVCMDKEKDVALFPPSQRPSLGYREIANVAVGVAGVAAPAAPLPENYTVTRGHGTVEFADPAGAAAFPAYASAEGGRRCALRPGDVRRVDVVVAEA